MVGVARELSVIIGYPITGRGAWPVGNAGFSLAHTAKDSIYYYYAGLPAVGPSTVGHRRASSGGPQMAHLPFRQWAGAGCT